jgi:tRNA A37 threonylcarbamoyladenosine synthetase subunit TsaC/SUA5/YrdC
LGNPILSGSLPGVLVEEYTDPEVIHEKFGRQVDMVIDGGIGGIGYSTIVDCSTNDWHVTREGIGSWEG